MNSTRCGPATCPTTWSPRPSGAWRRPPSTPRSTGCARSSRGSWPRRCWRRTRRPPCRNPNRVDVYSRAESAAILAHTATLTDLRGRQRHAIIATLRWTGARAGEISNLRRDRVDLPARRLEVLGKGSRPRILAVPEPLAGVLDRFCTEVRPCLPDTPYLFVNTHPFVPDPHQRCSVSALQRECRLAAQGAGIPGRHYPHRWRHSFATELIRAGMGVAQVQRQMGHASIVSTMLYTHLNVEDVRRSLDDVFGGEQR